MTDNKSTENVNNEQQAVGTLDYLKMFRKRRNLDTQEPDTQDMEVLKNNNELSENNINSLRNLDEATSFIKKIDSDVTQRWFFLAHALKKVRDEKLYEERFSTFQEYFNSELGYSKRMVYYFIDLADNYPIGTQEKLLELGVKKLLEIAELPEEQRNDYVENNNVSQMSAAAIKRDIQDKKKRSSINSEPKLEDDNLNKNLDENLSTGTLGSTAPNPIGISISKSELKIVSRYYKRIKTLAELIEKFKADQENTLPVEKLEVTNIHSQILELNEENEKFIKMINNYIN